METSISERQLTQLGRHVYSGMGQTLSRDVLQTCLDDGESVRLLTLLGQKLAVRNGNEIQRRDNLLKPFGRPIALPEVSDFSLTDHYLEGHRRNPSRYGVQMAYVSAKLESSISYIDRNYSSDKINAPAGQVQTFQLRSEMLDTYFLAMMGGLERVATNLAHVWELLRGQGQGQGGPLLVNGSHNVLYTNDQRLGLQPNRVSCWWSREHHDWPAGWALNSCGIFDDSEVWPVIGPPGRVIVACS